MSLNTHIDRVSDVLLSDGKWYEVADLEGEPGKSSFDIDAYEFDGGLRWKSGEAGFYFIHRLRNTGRHTWPIVIGPMSSVMALKRRSS